MAKKTLLAIKLIMVAVFFVACNTTNAQTGEGIGIHGLLSRVEYGDNTAYIFGSMHAGTPHWFPLAPVVEDAMARSQAFVFEYDISLNETIQSAIIMDFAANHPDTIGSLLPLLSTEQYNNFRQNLSTFPSRAIPQGFGFYNLSPFALDAAVVYYAFEYLGIVFNYSVDSYVLGVAQSMGAPILGLNHLVREAEHMFSIPTEASLQLLINFASREEVLRDAGLLAGLYAAQDIAGITEIFGELDDNAGDLWFYEVIMVQRSIEFAREIQRLLLQTQEPTTFFVTMGIGHMVGDSYANVFVYLAEQGFEIVGLY
ncbi:MAG: TraB/GumN family protein [Defluviitaleaceae bacterium]|nr:TraB/GumN family protein [Defluviitaleaceae bacterium]